MYTIVTITNLEDSMTTEQPCKEISGPFICGIGGKEVLPNVHEILLVCPAYGSDATYYYKLMDFEKLKGIQHGN